jgi:hypothetical protein
MFNVLITGVDKREVSFLRNILKEYGEKSILIEKAVGSTLDYEAQKKRSKKAFIRYLIDSRVYSLDENYTVEDLNSSKIPIRESHLVFGLEPFETLKNLKYVSEKTVVILNTHQIDLKQNIQDSKKKIVYPSIARIVDILDQLARKVFSLDFNELSINYFNTPNYSTIIALGAGVKEFRDIFYEKLVLTILREFHEDSSRYIRAFELGTSLID